jgi:hypothetical protein
MISAAERSIVRRTAAITVELELLEKKFALSGKGASAKDLDLYIRASGGLRRLLEALGLKRIPRDITPTLSDIARDVAALTIDEDAAAEAADNQ